jgi:hypothetical protein
LITLSTISLVLLSVLAEASQPAPNPRAKNQAQSLLTQGSALYERGDYAGALEKFTAAYTAYPSPKLMFNIGQANRDLGRPVEALAAFEKFLADAPDAAPDAVASAHKSTADLREKLGRIHIECERMGAEVNVDGQSVGTTPLLMPIWATPGRHQVTARHPSASPTLENVEVQAGSIQMVTLHLRPLAIPVAAQPAPAEPVANQPAAARPVAAPEPEPTPPLPSLPTVAAPSPPHPAASAGPTPIATTDNSWWLGRKWTWVAAGSTVLFGAGAIAAGLAMQSKFDALDKSCGDGNVTRPGCKEPEIAAVRSCQITANVLWGLTGAAALTTGVLFYLEGRPIHLVPMAGEATGLIATGRY